MGEAECYGTGWERGARDRDEAGSRGNMYCESHGDRGCGAARVRSRECDQAVTMPSRRLQNSRNDNRHELGNSRNTGKLELEELYNGDQSPRFRCSYVCTHVKYSGSKLCRSQIHM